MSRSLALVAIVPFLPLASLTWRDYRAEVARVEREIHASNREIAELAGLHLDALVRQVHDRVRLAGTEHAAVLPRPLGGVHWELVDNDGSVAASTLAAGRVGRRCGYEPLLLTSAAPRFSPVGDWIAGSDPTSVLVARVAAGRLLAAVIDAEALRRELTSPTAMLDRHVYVVDRSGRPLFYSDPEVTRQGVDLAANPPVRLLASGGEGEIHFTSVVSGKPRLGHVMPVTEADWGVVVSADVGARLLGARTRASALALSILFALVAASAILAHTSRRLTAPLLELRRALASTDRVPHAPLELRPLTRRLTEVDELARAIDELTARLAAAERDLVQAEKSLMLGQLASGLAHEVGTPLGVIRGNAQYLLRKTEEDDPSRATLELIVRQAERITAMIRRLLDFSRPTEATLGPVDLGSVVYQTLEMLAGVTGEVRVTLDLDPAAPPVRGDARLLEHALANLVLNACQAMPGGGELTIAVGALAGEDGGERVCLRVADTGCGIAAEHLPRVFEPFFTTKPTGQGTGLGLAIVERIVRQHGGTVAAASRPGAGSTFTVQLRPAAGR